MKNLKITLSIAALFIVSHSIQATEVQEQNTLTNQEAIYQLGFQPIDPSMLQHQPELINILGTCGDFPACDFSLNSFNQPMDIQPEAAPAQ